MNRFPYAQRARQLNDPEQRANFANWARLNRGKSASRLVNDATRFPRMKTLRDVK